MAEEHRTSSLETEFDLFQLIHIRAYGNPMAHKASVLEPLLREMLLNYGRRVVIIEVSQAKAVQLFQHEMEPEEVPKLDPQEVMPGLPLTPFAAG